MICTDGGGTNSTMSLGHQGLILTNLLELLLAKSGSPRHLRVWGTGNAVLLMEMMLGYASRTVRKTSRPYASHQLRRRLLEGSLVRCSCSCVVFCGGLYQLTGLCISLAPAAY